MIWPQARGRGTPQMVSMTFALTMGQEKGRNLALTGLLVPGWLDSGTSHGGFGIDLYPWVKIVWLWFGDLEYTV